MSSGWSTKGQFSVQSTKGKTLPERPQARGASLPNALGAIWKTDNSLEDGCMTYSEAEEAMREMAMLGWALLSAQKVDLFCTVLYPTFLASLMPKTNGSGL